MKKYVCLVLMITGTVQLQAQTRLKLGVYQNFGISNLYGNGSSNMTHGGSNNSMTMYSAKPSWGTGLTFKYFVKEKCGINLFLGYQQRGAMFDKGMYSYNPRYRFNYADIGLGLFYRTKNIVKQSRLVFSLNGTYHFLINSERVNNYESYNLMDDSQMSDIGVFASLGIDIPRVEKDIIEISLFANTGFKTVFGGVIASNGQTGKNILFGLQVGYLFGLSKKNKSEDK